MGRRALPHLAAHPGRLSVCARAAGTGAKHGSCSASAAVGNGLLKPLADHRGMAGGQR